MPSRVFQAGLLGGQVAVVSGGGSGLGRASALELAALGAQVVGLASAAGDYFSGAIITLDGARDNWFGSWPPGGLADNEGKPLAEERRPGP